MKLDGDTQMRNATTSTEQRDDIHTVASPSSLAIKLQARQTSPTQSSARLILSLNPGGKYAISVTHQEQGCVTEACEC